MSAEAGPGTGSAVEQNVEAIKTWEQALLQKRSRAQRFSDGITTVAASGASLLAHALWFTSWIAINTGVVTIGAPFDPFPFPILTMMVSLEAIFLALFVLASQGRLAKQSELRANLNLQIDLLAEHEMTTVLQMLRDISAHLKVKSSVTNEQLAELIEKTDVHDVASQVDPRPAQP